METRKSARLRAKGRRRWDEDESEGEKGNSSALEDSLSKEAPPKKRARVEGLDEEDDEEETREESDSRDDGDFEPPALERSQSQTQPTEGDKLAAPPKNWDQLFEEDDDGHESETIHDFPMDVDVFGDGKFHVIDGYVYRKLPTARKCGLGGYYLRCYQDKALNCSARATAVIRDDGTFSGKTMAKLSKTAHQHTHDRPPRGTFLVKEPSQADPVQPAKRRSSQRQEVVRRRGRPPRVLPSDDDNETDFGEEDKGSRYKLPIEIYGMQKYFVMDGYVYRRHRDRLVGHGGFYLRCYQDKELNCPARAVAVWFKKRAPPENETIGEGRERFLFGRVSTSYPKHSHSKPPKGHFWVKPGQQVILVPPKLRRSAATTDEATEYTDFTEPASDFNPEPSFSASATLPKRFVSNVSKSFEDHPYAPAESPVRSTESAVRPSDGQRRRLQQPQDGSTSVDSRARHVDRSTLVEADDDGREKKSVITMTVQPEQNGAYFMIDGYAFKRSKLGQPQLICAESKREFNCNARALLLSAYPPPKSSRSTELKARFTDSSSAQHTHSRPSRGQYLVAPTSTAPAPTTRVSSTATKLLPASTALMIFTHMPFKRPVTVVPQPESRSVNLKTIMNCYHYCLNALIRLQDGYYVGRFPALGKLVEAPGSELIEYYTHRSHNRLPMVAGDERTAHLLNHEMKHYRAICDFMLMTPNECEGIMEAYRRWLTPARTRAWWNNGDLLEYVCRLFLRTAEYSEAYLAALSMSQRSTRLKHMFRPLLPMSEPKFLRCEKETVRRWEMRQSLEYVNSRITSIRLREGDSDAAINRLLDEFEHSVASFMKFYNKYGAAGSKNKGDQSDVSNEDIEAEADITGTKHSSAIDRPPTLRLATEGSDFEGEPQSNFDVDSATTKTQSASGNKARSEKRPERACRTKFLQALRMRSKEADESDGDVSSGDYVSEASSGSDSPKRRRSRPTKRGRGRGGAQLQRLSRVSDAIGSKTAPGKQPMEEDAGSDEASAGPSSRNARQRGGAAAAAATRPRGARGGRGGVRGRGSVGGRKSGEAGERLQASSGGVETEPRRSDTSNPVQEVRGDDNDIARELDVLEAFAAE